VPLKQCLCIAVPTEPGPSGDLVSSSGASSDPTAQKVPRFTRNKSGSGKGRPREPCVRDGGRGLSLPKIREMAPWVSSNPQTFSTTSSTHVRPLLVQAEAAAYRHVQAHTSPLVVVSQTKHQQETSMKFKRETAVTTAQHIHTHLPPLHTPFLLGREAEGLHCKAAPTRTPFTRPESYTAVTLPVDAAELSSTAPARSLARHPRAGDVQEEPLRVPSPVQGRRVLWICGCR